MVKRAMLLLPFLAPALLASPGAEPADSLDGTVSTAKRRGELTGRFLHITDIHPDPFYRTNSSVAASCHHFSPHDDPQRAGPLGTPVSECDTPLALVEHTFDWLEKEWAGEVDFVVWTGDNARHDIDSTVPRSLKEILELNRGLAKRFKRLFEDKGIPVVPSLGNNDIYPHNIIRPGPNPTTTEFAKLWQDFFPGEDYHTVTRGIYFAREVIPDALMVVSLNTMYFFNNNKVIDGCPAPRQGEQPEPGTQQLEWLIVQLNRARDRGIQVWLSGHVPPTPSNWYPDCLDRFSEIVLSFQDTVLGQMYGHVNVDTFTYLDYRSLGRSDKKRRSNRVSVNKFIHGDIYSKYEDLPSAKKMKLEDFAIVHTGPSVIPTYLPSVRIWNYNVSIPEDAYSQQSTAGIIDRDLRSELWQQSMNKLEDLWKAAQGRMDLLRKKKRKKGKKNRRKKKKPIPRLPRYFSPESPSRTNRFLTPLGYTQYILPIDTVSNESQGPSWTIEYATYRQSQLRRFLPKRLYQGLNGTEVPTPYRLDDLTIPSWLGLARDLTTSKRKWQGYVKRMYVSALKDSDIPDL